jgi:hypothetical protein
MPAARIDVGALSGAIFGTIADRMASTVVRTMDNLDEKDNRLNQMHKVELVKCALEEFGTLEAMFAKTIVDELERSGVETWGLGEDLESLLGGAS